MKYKCGLCMISPSSNGYSGDKSDVITHIEDHGSEDIDLWLCKATEQTTLC